MGIWFEYTFMIVYWFKRILDTYIFWLKRICDKYTIIHLWPVIFWLKRISNKYIYNHLLVQENLVITGTNTSYWLKRIWKLYIFDHPLVQENMGQISLRLLCCPMAVLSDKLRLWDISSNP